MLPLEEPLAALQAHHELWGWQQHLAVMGERSGNLGEVAKSLHELPENISLYSSFKVKDGWITDFWLWRRRGDSAWETANSNGEMRNLSPRLLRLAAGGITASANDSTLIPGRRG